ncbi:hypothetical protein PR202_gb00758 [Eleusine coracana subsp. coracana]|uniref:Uncharacterized protein n=1 Tax=Eleusine coracana subsp. coracana TaxID=191504 RepID=A0AAV5DVP3_ELECO|nr:hypothetical protein PR202_gb00758 [Eleusine coracana subsp. coracana]
MPAEEEERVPDALSLFASSLSRHRFGDDDLRLLEAALSAGADVPAMLATRSSARRLLRARAAEAFLQPPGGAEDHGRILSVADFFARAFALVGDVESCLAMRYEALVLRDAKYSNHLQLQVSREEWLTFAKDSLDNGFYAIASKAFANALARGHIHSSNPGRLDSTNSIKEKDKINDITGLQNLSKSLSGQHPEHIFFKYHSKISTSVATVDTQAAEYMKRRASGVHAKYKLQSGKPKLPGSSMFMLGIKTRNIKKLLQSRERNLSEI